MESVTAAHTDAARALVQAAGEAGEAHEALTRGSDLRDFDARVTELCDDLFSYVARDFAPEVARIAELDLPVVQEGIPLGQLAVGAGGDLLIGPDSDQVQQILDGRADGQQAAAWAVAALVQETAQIGEEPHTHCDLSGVRRLCCYLHSPLRSITWPDVRLTSCAGRSAKTACGVPAAAQTVSYCRRSSSMKVAGCLAYPTGGTPPAL